VSRREYAPEPESAATVLDINAHDFLVSLQVEELGYFQRRPKPRKQRLYKLSFLDTPSTDGGHVASMVTRSRSKRAGTNKLVSSNKHIITDPGSDMSIGHEHTGPPLTDNLSYTDSSTRPSPQAIDVVEHQSAMHAQHEIDKYVAPSLTLDNQQDDVLFRDVIAYLLHKTLPADRDAARKLLF